MSLVGTQLLGSTFVQDTNPLWIKIDNVTLGESQQYSYKMVTNNDIGSLLSYALTDSNCTVVNYNWQTGVGYMKTGFDTTFSNSSDSKNNSGYTAFVLKSHIANVSTPSNNTTPAPQAQVTIPSGTQIQKTCKCKYKCYHPIEFVYTSGPGFSYRNFKYLFVGPNVYWMGLNESSEYPSKYQIEEMFIVAKKMQATAIRTHTIGHSSGSANSLRPSNNNLNQNAWPNIDFAFYMAEQYQIKLICPLTDSYQWYNGNYGDYCNTRGVDKTQFWTDGNVRNDFKNYINQWLNHVSPYNGLAIKDNPALGLIELGNEMGNIRPDSGSTTIPTFEWLTDIVQFIRTIDTKHLILCPSDECLGQANEFNVNFDSYSSHFYGFDYTRLDNGLNGSTNVQKPFIIGEYSSQFDSSWFAELEKRAISGSLFWSLYCHQNGIYGGSAIPHDDGCTVHYPEDSGLLLGLSNHFRRLQGLPEISSI